LLAPGHALAPPGSQPGQRPTPSARSAPPASPRASASALLWPEPLQPAAQASTRPGAPAHPLRPAALPRAPAGGITENDFIVASRINDLELADLLQKKRVRYWA
jgi:hypothetical protein